jgi:hypothetical protein
MLAGCIGNVLKNFGKSVPDLEGQEFATSCRKDCTIKIFRVSRELGVFIANLSGQQAKKNARLAFPAEPECTNASRLKRPCNSMDDGRCRNIMSQLLYERLHARAASLWPQHGKRLPKDLRNKKHERVRGGPAGGDAWAACICGSVHETRGLPFLFQHRQRPKHGHIPMGV